MGAIVITGSSRGIGFGLARAFLERGQQVVLSGSRTATVEQALEQLGAHDALHGLACDVTDPDQVQRLWDGAVERFGGVAHWINNAGVVNPPRSLAEQAPEDYLPAVQVNLAGSMHGCAVALRGMAEQPDGGSIWNLEGLGSDGRVVEGSTPYATTKYALSYLTRALAKEVEGTSVRVGSIQPGMVVTDLLLDSLERYPPDERERVERIFDTLADRIEDVCPWVADQVLASNGNGARIRWLGPFTVAWRFATAPFRTRGVLERPVQRQDQ